MGVVSPPSLSLSFLEGSLSWSRLRTCREQQREDTSASWACALDKAARALGLFNSPLPLPWAREHPVILSYPQPELRPCGEIEGSEGRKGQPVTTTRAHTQHESHASCGALPSPPRRSLPASCSLPLAGQKDLRSGLPGLGLLGLSCFSGHVLPEWHLGPF